MAVTDDFPVYGTHQVYPLIYSPIKSDYLFPNIVLISEKQCSLPPDTVHSPWLSLAVGVLRYRICTLSWLMGGRWERSWAITCQICRTCISSLTWPLALTRYRLLVTYSVEATCICTHPPTRRTDSLCVWLYFWVAQIHRFCFMFTRIPFFMSYCFAFFLGLNVFIVWYKSYLVMDLSAHELGCLWIYFFYLHFIPPFSTYCIPIRPLYSIAPFSLLEKSMSEE